MAGRGGEQCGDGGGFSSRPHGTAASRTAAGAPHVVIAAAGAAPVVGGAAREHISVERGMEALLAAVQGVVGELRDWERHNVVPCQQHAFSQIVQRLSAAAHEAARAQTSGEARDAPCESAPRSANHMPARTVTQEKVLRTTAATPQAPAGAATGALDAKLTRLELRERHEPTRARSDGAVVSPSSRPGTSTVPTGYVASQSASASGAAFLVPATMPRERQTSNVFDAPSSASHSRNFMQGEFESPADAMFAFEAETDTETETELHPEPAGQNGDGADGHVSTWKGTGDEASRSSFDATLAAAVSGEWSAAPPGCAFSQEPCTGDSDSDDATNAVMRVVMRPIEQPTEVNTDEDRVDVQQLGTTAGPPDFSSLIPVEHRPPNGQWLRAVGV